MLKKPRWFYYWELKRRIQRMGLAELKEMIEVLEEFFPEASKKQIAGLCECWTAKVLLLVTGIDDVMMMFHPIRDWRLRCQLAKGYAEQTRSINNIITLLSHLFNASYGAMQLAQPKVYLDVLATETILIERAKELIPTSYFGQVNVNSLAQLIRDEVGDGTGSRAAEEVVVALAIPMLKDDLMGAMWMAQYFKTQTGKYHLYRTFVETYGLANSYQVRELVQRIKTAQYGGNDLATAILNNVDSTGLVIGYDVRANLQALSGTPTRPRSRLGLVIGHMMSRDHNLDPFTKGRLIDLVADEFEGNFSEGQDGRLPFMILITSKKHSRSDHGRCLKCPDLSECQQPPAVQARMSMQQ